MKYPSKLTYNQNFATVVKDNKICFLKINVDSDTPYIDASVTVLENLSLVVTIKNVVITESLSIKNFLNDNCSCITWTEFNDLMAYINSSTPDSINSDLDKAKILVKNACITLLEKCIVAITNVENKWDIERTKLTFTKDQLSLAFCKQKR